MFTDNNATRIKRELMIKVAELFFAGELLEKIDTIPVEMFPHDKQSVRCCIYKDRAITRFRLMAILGLSVENKEDEITLLKDYAAQALEREKPTAPILTVMQEACKSCVKANYMVTNACQGCVARPCYVSCPKDAISFKNGRAEIDPEKCVNCGRCKQVCPYHAIIYMPVPCEESCPVDAIYRDENGKENIDFEKCIFCGKCTRACPFGAIMERSQIIDVLKHLTGENITVALLAPSVVGQLPGSLEQVCAALKALGFDIVAEVASGAETTAKLETEELMERLEDGASFMTTSCCPAYTMAVKKHISELSPFVSHTPTPMHFAAKWSKENYPDAKTIFVGPCVAKRQEALDDPFVDYVLTFDEVGSLMVAKGINSEEMESEELDLSSRRSGRIFPISGGVATSIRETLPEGFDFNPVIQDGLGKKEVKVLRSYAKKGLPGNFLEVMSCEGGCVAGPGVLTNPKIAKMKVEKISKED